MSAVITVEGLSKQYRLGSVGTGSVKHDMLRWWDNIRGREDRFLKIGETNDRTTKAGSEYVWALKNISFEVNSGEVLGIIGRNGAGKSTLLKILSRVTEPSTGRIEMNGRVASLLEVGTGFHPDLTGRENIYLNGAILGMTKKEVTHKLDEIIDFAGVERYIDTPVKRYSSGMHVRLGFAVAAHLEPEILIVDEVLAVGDAEFQKKCLGKMRDINKSDHRTILFVSHNMTAVKNICQSALLLENGNISKVGRVEDIVALYETKQDEIQTKILFNDPHAAPGNAKVKLKRLEILTCSESDVIYIDTPVNVEFEFWNYETDASINLSLHVYNYLNECVFNVHTKSKKLHLGLHLGKCYIPANFLNDNYYRVKIMVVGDLSYAIYDFSECVSFQVFEKRAKSDWHGKHPGYIRPKLNFTLEQTGN